MTERRARVYRETLETKVAIELDLNGDGSTRLESPLPFLNHMLSQLSKHGRIGIVLEASGDTDVDPHHLMEDVGIVLGEAFGEALGDKTGIRRFGWAMVPMDDALASVALDVSGRPYFIYNVPLRNARVGQMEADLFEELLRAFVFSAKACLHVNIPYAQNPHHMIEAVFKALALAMKQALQDEGSGIPSTKGVL